MLNGEDLALRCAFGQLLASYWADVDENGGRRAHEPLRADGGELLRTLLFRRAARQ